MVNQIVHFIESKMRTTLVPLNVTSNGLQLFGTIAQDLVLREKRGRDDYSFQEPAFRKETLKTHEILKVESIILQRTLKTL